MLPTTLRRPLPIRPRLLILAALAAVGACKSQSPKPSEPASSKGTIDARVASTSEVASAVADEPCSLPSRSYRHQAPGRLIAIGDIHGDLQAARRALRLGGAIDEADHWIGGDLQVVQTGDILDRGDDEQEILDLFVALDAEAKAAGGAIHRLNGNHELMNAMGDFRYVTRGGFEDFVEGETPRALTEEARKRAFFPGGPYARQLAEHDLVGVVGDSVFVHGGVLPRFVEGLEQSNLASRCFLLGESTEPPQAVLDPEGPLWTRVFSSAEPACELLQETLDKLGVARMVVGHTPQLSGITSACDGKVWRVDTGMAEFYGGPTQVLEIEGDKVRVLE